MESASDYTPFQKRLTEALVPVMRNVGQVPVTDLTFHRSSNAEVSEALDEQSGRLLSLTSSILKAATAGTDIPAPKLTDEDSIEYNWRGIVDVIDGLLEKADACLDEFTGVIKKLSPSLQDKEGEKKSLRKDRFPTRFPTIYDYGPSKIPKPQIQFEHQIDPQDTSPFTPLLKTKPHAIEPLEQSLAPPAGSTKGHRNPYETEIRAAEYPKSAYVTAPPIDYLPFESTTATYVDTLEGLKEMLAELKSAKEIAIDLEHHDVHSYHGLVSLMQISTREKDWVVDTLKPWREELQMLNEVFADPSIIKLFHGASMDIIWLQRDLGLYVVGMFDTYHAAYVLNYQFKSLKFLLKKFVNFEADKQYQMADWRVRPLPSGMFDYARSDTHYLLYIYDNIRNELLENSTPENNLVDYVLKKSKEEALQRYERPVYDAATGQGAGGWYDLMARNPAVFSKEQFAVFRAVHQWRDNVAREVDEGVQCVFPKHVLFRVAQALPVNVPLLLTTLAPVTPLARDRVEELFEVIQNAKSEGASGPEWRDIFVKPTKSPQQLQGTLTPPTTDGSHPTAVRYEVSQFWGSVLNLQTPPQSPPQYSILASAEALRLSLPLPPMSRTVSEAREKPAPQPVKPTATPTPKEEEEEKPENRIFTIKDLGGPRKRKSGQLVEPESVSTSEQETKADHELDEISLDVESPPNKKQRRKERREQKRKEKEAKGQNRPLGGEEAQEAEEEDTTTPFNYDNADSVLNANPHATPRLPSKKPFNPYAKALQAPSGVRKEKKEIAGKSHTFR
ncbi:ribonuclease H-like domain-containing protein [Aspergillus karnatakaensis]|uniref:exosome nuclease subunit RRP6 n=1 Tax=Aspergillus karnatakaensis TaxID=1810916 RepID=UPI003CCE2C77